MGKITDEQAFEIYKLATDPLNTMSNREIGEKYGIGERSVRFRVTKLEKELHKIAKTKLKVASALASHTVNVVEEAASILSAVKDSISEAKSAGISPEKLSGLYGNWIKSLETLSELLGDIDRSPVVNVQVVNQQFNDLVAVVMEECDEATKTRIGEKLKLRVSK